MTFLQRPFGNEGRARSSKHRCLGELSLVYSRSYENSSVVDDRHDLGRAISKASKESEFTPSEIGNLTVL